MATSLDKSIQTSTDGRRSGLWAPRSIRSRLMLLVGMVLVAAVGLSLRSTLWVLESQSGQESRRELEQAGKAIEQSIREQTSRISVQSRLLSTLPILRAVLDTRDIPTIRDTARDYRTELAIDVVDLYDARGRFLVGVGELATASERAWIRGLVAQAIRGRVVAGWMPLQGRIARVVAGPVGQGGVSGVSVLGVFYGNERASELGIQIRGDVELRFQGSLVASSQPGRAVFDPAEFQSSLRKLEEGGPELSIHLSQAAGLKTRSAVRRTVLFQALVILLISLAFAAWVSRSVTGPVLRLKGTAAQIIESNSLSHRAEIQGSDEVSELGRVFNHLLDELEERNRKLEEYNRTLEQRVAERTAELQESNLDRETLLNNLDQGYLTFDVTGTVRKGSTVAAAHLFGVEPTGLRFPSLLGIAETDAATLIEVLAMVEQGVLHPDDLWPLLPKVFENSEARRIELEYRLMKDLQGNPLGRFICIASDKTEEYHYRRAAEKEAAQTKMIVGALAQREAFLEVIQSCIQSAEDIKANLIYYGLKHPGGLQWYRGQIHTLKGNLASFSLEGAAKALHALEDQIAQAEAEYGPEVLESFLNLGMAELDWEFKRFQKEFGLVLGIGKDGVRASKVITQEDLDLHYAGLRKELGEGSPVVQAFKQRWVLDDAKVLFGHFAKVVEEIAPRWSKEIQFSVLPSEVRVRASRYRGLTKAMVHLFRNSVVHGIEFPDERTAQGKLRQGQITVLLEPSAQGASRIRMVISDDGAGIQVQKLKQAAAAAKVLAEEAIASMSDEEAVNLVFMAGVSTSTEVTDVAGRGFGLSALAAEVRDLGGTIQVSSIPGKGTTFTIETPAFTES